jgi:hypothetical protein
VRAKTLHIILAFSFAMGGLFAGPVLYTDLGPGDSFGTGGGGFGSGGGSFNGTTFVATASGVLGEVLVGLYTDSPSPGELTIGLYASLADQPGALLESWTATFPPVQFGSLSLTTLVSSQNPFVSGGTQSRHCESLPIRG